MDASAPPWFRSGLRFECTRCGACCAGAPGYVWVEYEEIRRLAERLALSIEQFGKAYLRRVGNRLSLIETSEHACIFWDSRDGCTVYDARPDQCRTWPFWRGNLASPADWERTAGLCPGIGRGPVHGADQILAALDGTPE